MHTLTLDDVTIPAPPASAADWNDDGVVIARSFIDPAVIDAYRHEWWRSNGRDELNPFDRQKQPFIIDTSRRGGWPYDVPYRHHRALRDLVCDQRLADLLASVVGEPMGVHLNLSGWVTTERDWHQDSYLNPLHVGDYYAAVWFALGDVHPDSGPFQYVPGSHRWPQVTRDLIGNHVDLNDPMWPKHSETVLSPLFNDEIADRKAKVVSYLPRKGDVLVWHGRLLHRGSKARIEGTYRPALIAHYSGVYHRPDMPHPQRAEAGGWYFPIDQIPR